MLDLHERASLTISLVPIGTGDTKEFEFDDENEVGVGVGVEKVESTVIGEIPSVLLSSGF